MIKFDDAFYTEQEKHDFIYKHHQYECGCCHCDISDKASEEIKKRIDENLINMTLELFICDECVKDETCKKVNYRPYPHTEKGKSWVLKTHQEHLEFMKSMKDFHELGRRMGAPSFEEWMNGKEFPK